MIFSCLTGDPACDMFNCILGVLIVTSPVWGLAFLGWVLYARHSSPRRKSSLRIEKAHVVMYPGAVRPEGVSEKKLKTALYQGAKYLGPYQGGFTYSNGLDSIDVPEGYMVIEE